MRNDRSPTRRSQHPRADAAIEAAVGCLNSTDGDEDGAFLCAVPNGDDAIELIE
ncbi:hypothetical protein [Halovivax asiaticus]|uniref:hypothetical protein n=1 Tax=Halovivax asiaticus TaxID=332953 RepID=UPI001F4C65C9|nr:hypothetical protein [Halovivax asiaticus]